MSPFPTLVACSHGTASPRARELMTALAATAADLLPGTPVTEMFVDVQEPSLEDSLPAVTGPVVVVPVFLSSGYHLHHDIHTAVERHPDAAVTAALGPDTRLAEVQVQRLLEVGAEPGDTVVMAASASSHPRANADVAAAFALLRRSWRGAVSVGFVGGRGTSVAEAVASARLRGRRVVVSTYLLMPGYFSAQVAAAGADLTTAPLLADDDPTLLAGIIAERYRSACARAVA